MVALATLALTASVIAGGRGLSLSSSTCSEFPRDYCQCCRHKENSILEDKELKRKLMDLKKSFLICQMYPKYLAAHLCVAAIRKEASIILQKQDVKKITLVDW